MPSAPRRPIAAGDLIGLIEDGRPRLAVVIEVHGARCSLRLGAEGKALQRGLRQLDLLAALPAELEPPQRINQPPWRLSADAVDHALPRPREFGAAWMLLVESGEVLDLPGFVSLVGEGDDPAQRAACWQWLQGEQKLFRWRQEQVEARPLVDVRRLRRDQRRQQLAEQARKAWQESLRLRRPIDAGVLGPLQRSQLDLMRDWAAGDHSQPLPDDLRRALQVAHCHAEAGAIRHLLADLGQWERHHLPSLDHSPWQKGFRGELASETERLMGLSEQTLPGDQGRRDLTGLMAVTIDDDDTDDIDDGLSLERMGEHRWRVWIHVADPGRLVEPGSPLDLEARRRGASLYLARGTLPMFPSELATGPFSLRSGRRSAAWSVAVELADDGSVAGYAIERSWVKPAYRLSYDDAEELIELAPPQEAWLAEMHGLMERRRRWRLARGALCLDQPEGRIRAGGQEAQLQISEPSPSRQMVAEAMVLAGTVIAEHGRRMGLALPYRSQLPAELPPAAELEALPAGPVRHAALKRCLSRGVMGVRASPHFSLGVEAYVQATSPIRRYGDLVVQRQLQAAASGTAPLGEVEMGELISQLEGPLKQGIQISREDQRHWQQVWFEQQHSHQSQWQAQFLRWLKPQDRLGLVHAEDLAMDLAAECPAGSEPGDALLLRVLEVDSLRDHLKLQGVA